MKVIETQWNGYRFRSRLEARWAVFLTAAQVRWEYEPEGYYLGDGISYLPDFYLPDLHGGTWLEISPETGKDDKCEKMSRLVLATGKRGIVMRGGPWLVHSADSDPYDHVQGSHEMIFPPDESSNEPGYDWPYLFCVCSDCGKVGLEYDGRGDRVCKGTECKSAHASGDKGYSWDHAKLVRAANAAKSARYEFGEKPTVRKPFVPSDLDF